MQTLFSFLDSSEDIPLGELEDYATKTNNITRKEMQKKRKILFKNHFLYSILSLRCQEYLITSKQWKQAEHVALYSAVHGEVNTDFLAQKAYEANKQIYYPRCIANTCTLEFVRIAQGTSLEKASYSIQEPPSCLKATPLPPHTLIVTPGLAFNHTGYRLGYGKGYYDRLLNSNDFIAIGLSFSFQLTHSLVPNCWDKKINALSTEDGFLCISEQYDFNSQI